MPKSTNSGIKTTGVSTGYGKQGKNPPHQHPKVPGGSKGGSKSGSKKY